MKKHQKSIKKASEKSIRNKHQKQARERSRTEAKHEGSGITTAAYSNQDMEKEEAEKMNNEDGESGDQEIRREGEKIEGRRKRNEEKLRVLKYGACVVRC
jgi:hypothetical protein